MKTEDSVATPPMSIVLLTQSERHIPSFLVLFPLTVDTRKKGKSEETHSASHDWNQQAGIYFCIRTKDGIVVSLERKECSSVGRFLGRRASWETGSIICAENGFGEKERKKERKKERRETKEIHMRERTNIDASRQEPTACRDSFLNVKSGINMWVK